MPALRAPYAAFLAAALLAACSSKSSSEPSACDGPSPVAIAGPDRTLARGAQVQLEAGSGAAEGPVTYVWRLDSIPPGSGAALSSSSDARPTFTADAAGVYVVSLTVQDGCATSAPDLAVIVVPNAAPVAVAGHDQSVEPGATVTLDGGGSGDPDGDPLSFGWSLAARPSGSGAALSSATAPAPTFVADVAGTYVAVLVVSDGAAQSAVSAVTIRAGGETQTGGCSPASAPVASAGPDQTLSYTGTVRLDGTGSQSSRPYPLIYRWSLTAILSGGSVNLTDAMTASPSFYANRSGMYVASLVVNDGCTDSAPDSVTITLPNHAPTANAGYDREVPTGVEVMQDGWGYDADYGDPMTYAWALVSRPPGSAAAVSAADTSRPRFVPDADGQYVLSLVVRDGTLESAPDTVTITAANKPPIARAGPDRAAGVGATVTLDGSASTDANGSTLDHRWTLIAPAASEAALSASDTARPTFVPDVKGVYVARLVVSDGASSVSDDVSIAVWPAMHVLQHRVIDAEYSRALDRIVTVGASPNALRLLDPRTHAETLVALELAPSSVSVSPDGLFAAVGHTNAISYVNLQTGAVEKVLAVTGDVVDLALGEGRAYAVPRVTSDRARILSVRLDTGDETWGTSNQTGTVRVKLSTASTALYAAGATSYSAGLERFDLSAGTAVLASSAEYAYGSGACGDVWLSEAGTRLFTRCGSVFRASSSWIEDLRSAGSLVPSATPSSSGTFARHVSDSSAAGEISAITRGDVQGYSWTDDDVLRRYEAAALGLRETAPFPSELVNGTSYGWRGRYVFYRSDGTERYVIAQLDPASSALLDFGLATF
jgi:chitinase